MKAIANIASGWLLALTFVAAQAAALAAESRPAETQPAATQPATSRLQFKVSTEAFRTRRGADVDVNYVASISIRETVSPESLFGFESSSERGTVIKSLETRPAGQSFSERQRLMIARAREPYDVSISNIYQPGSVHHWTLFAVTEDDARKMATALVQCYEQNRLAHREQNRKALHEKQDTIRETEKKRQEVVSKVKGITQELDEIRKGIIFYSMRDVAELDKALRSVEIDLASIQAKIDTIKKLQNDFGTKGTMLPVLDQMMITQDVDLAGALARKAALQRQCKTARGYIQLLDQEVKSPAETRDLEKKLVNLRKEVSILESQLGPVEVVGDVTIYRAQK